MHPELPAPRKSRRGRRLAAFEPALCDLLERYPDITVVRLLEELRGKGYTGSYTVLREQVRLRRIRPARPPVVRFETPPGAQAQMDWGTYEIDFTLEGRRRVQLFSYLLSYSRRQYLCFTEQQDMENTLRQHVRAFEYLGGVAATCLYDNMKVVVQRWEDDHPVYNTRFLTFATHYGYRPVACRPRRPETKGKVERAFLYAEKNLLNGRTFRTLEHLNEVTRWWLANVADVRQHRETKKRPLDAHAEELPHLLSLPAHAYDTALVVYRMANPEGWIDFRQNHYSVPWQYIGELLPVRVTEDELLVYNNQLETIAQHRLLPRQVSGQTAARSPASAPAQPAGPSRAPAATLWGTGRGGAALSGRSPPAAAVWQTSGRAGLGLVAHLATGRSAGGHGTCRPLPRLRAQFAGTHPGHSGHAQDSLASSGSGRPVAAARPAAQRDDPPAGQPRVPTPVV